MKIPKIIDVSPQDNLILLIKFSDGKIRNYDCKKILDRNEYYQRLKNKNYFKNVQIDSGGHGVSWDDNVDISEHEILTNSYT